MFLSVHNTSFLPLSTFRLDWKKSEIFSQSNKDSDKKWGEPFKEKVRKIIKGNIPHIWFVQSQSSDTSPIHFNQRHKKLKEGQSLTKTHSEHANEKGMVVPMLKLIGLTVQRDSKWKMKWLKTPFWSLTGVHMKLSIQGGGRAARQLTLWLNYDIQVRKIKQCSLLLDDVLLAFWRTVFPWILSLVSPTRACKVATKAMHELEDFRRTNVALVGFSKFEDRCFDSLLLGLSLKTYIQDTHS